MLEKILPYIVQDHNAKTYLVIRAGRKFIHTIPMKSGKLTIRKLTYTQYKAAQFKVLDLDLRVAIDRFLKHSGGHTETALKELNMMLEGFEEYSA
jgi:hypothetical protein